MRSRSTLRPSKAPSPRMEFEELEPRLLFSADPLVASLMGVEGLMTSTVAPAPASNIHVLPAAALQSANQAAASVAATRSEIVFIDMGVDNAEQLAKDLAKQGDGLRVVLIGKNDDGLKVITDTLAQSRGITAVHIVSHGDHTGLKLGHVFLDQQSLNQNLSSISSWGAALTADADLMLYGCDLAADATGQALVSNLSLLTGADVAASTNLTGAAALGGDWTLEHQVGQINTNVVIDATMQAQWQGVLGVTAAGSETLVNSAGTTNDSTTTNRQVAMDSSGNYVAVWQTSAGALEAARYNASGVMQGAKIAVTSTSTPSNTQVAMSDSGTFVIVWQDSTNSIHARRYNAAGVLQGSQIDIATGSTSGSPAPWPYTITENKYSDPTVSMNNSTGDFVVAYHYNVYSASYPSSFYAVPSSESTNDTIRFNAYSSAGAAQGGATDVSSNTQGNDDPSIARNSSGAFAISWTNSNGNIYARFYDAARNAITSAADITGNTGGSQSSIATNATSTGYVIAYNDSGIIKYRTYNSTGGGAGTLSQANLNPPGTSPGNTRSMPSAAMDASGNFVIAWQNTSQDGSSEGVYLRQFYANGTSGKSDIQVATSTTGNQQRASVALYGSNAVVVWSGAGNQAGQTDAQGMFFQRYTLSSASAPGAVTTTGGSMAYTENATTAVDSGVSLAADPDSDYYMGATITIGTGYASGQDVLNFTTQNGITGSYLNGVLTLTGQATIAQYQTALQSITYTNTSDAPSTATRTVTFQVSDGANTNSGSRNIAITAVNDVPIITSNGGGGTASISIAENTTTVTTVTSTDADGDTRTYTISGGADAAKFAINATTGALTFLVAPNHEALGSAAGNNTYYVTVKSSDPSTANDTQDLTITVTDADEFDVTAVSDTNAAANGVAENAANGTAVGITASASDADSTTNTITYSLSNSASGRFTINATTGVVTVANGTLLNYESATSHSITVVATSADGSSSSQAYTINLTDVDEFNVGTVTDTNGTANTIAENTANGSTVGITASASDADGTTNTITYSLSNSASGRFTINSSTGVVTVADSSQLNYESATSHSITVVATSADGSSTSQAFTITLTDVDEFDVGAVSDSNAGANTVAENAANGTVVGVTASASDADATTNTITYSLSNNAGGRFTINSSTGVVTVANGTLLNYESATSYSITVVATSSDTSTSSQSFTINLSDVDEFDVGAISDTNATANTVAENSANGSLVGITASASDADGSNSTITYSLSNNAGGRFTINASTGVVTVANSTLLNYEAATSYSITVVATSADTSTASQAYIINLSDVDEFDVGAVSDSNAAANTIAENVANGTAVGITASASDADATTNTITYSLSNSASGRFTINASTGVVTVANNTLLNYESATSHSITVVATSADGSSTSQAFTINLTDVDEFDVGTISDSNAGANTVAENVANGTVVGVTASASDADGSNNTITYTLSNNAGGRFAINATTGVVTVANGTLLNYESATSHSITVVATSSDTSTSSQSFTINLSDVDEFDVGAVSDTNGAANTIAENTANGSAVGITASASDLDGSTNTISYSLSNSAGGRFAINASTGVVTVANSTLLNYESATSHSITVVATSADGSTSNQTFTVTLTDVDEFDVSAVSDSNAAANTIAENLANGSAVGITAAASDADGSNSTITYTLSNSAGGRFAVNASTGVVTVANSGLLNYESATSHSITVVATSADGSTSSQSFTISLTDVDEFDVGAVSDSNAGANAISEITSNGTTVGITASASDADASNSTITYTLTDSAGGRFAINASTGVVTVADNSLLDYETATSHNITVQATSADGSISTQVFTINVLDGNENGVSLVSDADVSANVVLENAANGSTVGITGHATDADIVDTVSYSLLDNAGGRFTIDSTTGVVTVLDGSLLDRETASSYDITIVATSSDTSSTSETYTINIGDVNETPVSAVVDANGGANTILENTANGTVVGITASASDLDATNNTVTYTLLDDAGGRFTIDANTGVVTVLDGSLLDFEAATSHTITVVATSADGSTSNQAFTINLADVDEFDVGAISDANGVGNTIAENLANGSAVGVTASAQDADASTNTITYTLTDSASGRFAINASTGVVTVLDGSLLNYESATSHTITVEATSADGSTSTQTFTINLTDVDEFNVGVVSDTDGTVDTIAENTANGTLVGITASASDLDATNNTISYSLSNSAGGRFAIDATTGVVTVLDGSLLNYESAASHSITVVATSADGSTSSQTFTINLTDIDEFNVGAIADANAGANTVVENAANGSTVGVTASASDLDGTTNTISYALTDDAGGRFVINAATGVVTVADGSLLDFETATSHSITVVATSADGSTSTQSFTIQVGDADEFDVGAVSDADGVVNTIAENTATGSTVGITASASDLDASTNTITYTLTGNAGGRFAIDANTGVVTVANGSLLNYESATSHTITVVATSADGSTSTQSFTINLTDVNEFAVGAISDVDAAAALIGENAVNGSTVGITASASDLDATHHNVTYSLSDDAGGRFIIDTTTGVVTVNDGSLLDHEAATSHGIIVVATSSDGSTSTQAFTIQVGDADEFDVGAVSDADGTANTIAENTANGSAVGITASASDADGSTNAITYTLLDSAGGRFAINASTGVVTVANGSLLNYESATSHTITVVATSADGSTSSQAYTINLTDVNEFAVGTVSDTNGTANTIAENTANGSTVGITASASDLDATNSTITYSLSDSAGGRFTINTSTGVVTVADGSLLNYESATSHTITVVATSSDGSTSTQAFTVNLSDVDEFDVGAISDANGSANTITENAANGSTVGITASASDLDATTSTITYTLLDNAGGRFAINASTGVVTVADGSLLNFEAATSHTITVVATSADGSTSSQAYTINLTDVNEFAVSAIADTNGAASTIAENTATGSTVGITASASDADGTTNTVTYTLTNNAGGRFAINASTGVVTVADGSLLDFETATSHTIRVVATSSDGSTSTQDFTITLTDRNEFDVTMVADGNGAANTVLENAANGSTVGFTASAFDADGSNNAIGYFLSDDAGGRFAIDINTGVVTVANGSLLDHEGAASHTITVIAASTDGSYTAQTFTIQVGDVDEFDVSPIADSDGTANTIVENTATGSTVGLTASASDLDASNSTVTYTLLDNAGGRFAINASTGVVTVANGALLNFEAATSHTITVVATSADGSTSSQAYTINLADVDEFDVSPIADTDGTTSTLAENTATGSTVGLTASASDLDATTSTITYTLQDDAGGRFAINATTGVVTVANGSLLNFEVDTSHTITVVATSADGSTSTQAYTISLTDVDEFDVSPIADVDGATSTLAENTATGSLAGITASASDLDATASTVTFTLTNDAGGRFAIDATTGVVTIANGALLDFESAASHTITVVATSADGSTSTRTFTIDLTDVNETAVSPVLDANGSTNAVLENAANGSTVGITASASDLDATQSTVSYTLTDDAGGRFAIDASTGVVTVANGSLLNFEAGTSHTITVVATSADGSTSTQTFTIGLTDVDEFDVGAIANLDSQTGPIRENTATGSTVGITASAQDADGSASTITYTLTNNAGGRFAIDATTGVVTVANGSLLNYESATSHTITVVASSADGSTSSQDYTIELSDLNEFGVGAILDADGSANRVTEQTANGATVGLTVSATDRDATNSTVTYTLLDNAGGRFTIDSHTGVVTVANASLLDYEAASSHSITVMATSADGSSTTHTLSISLIDVNEAPILPPAPAPVETVLTGSEFATHLDPATFADPDQGDTVTLTTSPLPDWLTFDPDTITFSGSPNAGDVGHWEITIFATDSQGATAETVYEIDIVRDPADLLMQNGPAAGWDLVAVKTPVSLDLSLKDIPSSAMSDTNTSKDSKDTTSNTDIHTDTSPLIDSAEGDGALTVSEGSSSSGNGSSSGHGQGKGGTNGGSGSGRAGSGFTNMQGNGLQRAVLDMSRPGALNWDLGNWASLLPANLLASTEVTAIEHTAITLVPGLTTSHTDMRPMDSHDPAVVSDNVLERIAKVSTVKLETGSLVLSLGSVWWAARGAGLITGLLATTPVWRQIDPLPVMFAPKEEDGRDGSEPQDAHHEKAEAMFGEAPERVDMIG